MTFGKAIKAIKAGKAVARSGWNGKGMCIYLVNGAHDFTGSAGNITEISNIDSDLFDRGQKGIITRLPHINMRTANGTILTGWLASQSDILAMDWQIVN